MCLRLRLVVATSAGRSHAALRMHLGAMTHVLCRNRISNNLVTSHPLLQQESLSVSRYVKGVCAEAVYVLFVITMKRLHAIIKDTSYFNKTAEMCEVFLCPCAPVVKVTKCCRLEWAVANPYRARLAGFFKKKGQNTQRTRLTVLRPAGMRNHRHAMHQTQAHGTPLMSTENDGPCTR